MPFPPALIRLLTIVRRRALRNAPVRALVCAAIAALLIFDGRTFFTTPHAQSRVPSKASKKATGRVAVKRRSTKSPEPTKTATSSKAPPSSTPKSCGVDVATPCDQAGSPSLPEAPPQATAWLDAEIGSTHVPGGNARNGDVIAVAGAGLGFVTTDDQMHFTYQRVRGDVDIVARLRGIVDPHPLAIGGIMVRGSLDADGTYAALTSASQVGVLFSRRLARGWTRLETAASASASWFKLERRSALVSAFVSDDGVRWEFIGGELVNLDDEVHVGLLAASHQAGTLTTAVFDRVDIRSVVGPGIPGSSPAPVAAPLPGPTPTALKYLVFEPSPDHATVTSYVFEVALADAAQGPVLQRDIGKPAVVNGECRVDVSALLALLPSGSYIALVRAANANGLSVPGVSAPFSW